MIANKAFTDLPSNADSPRSNLSRSLKYRTDQVLIAAAVLGLTASSADGEPEIREIDCFYNSFKRRFVLSSSRALKIIGLALRKIRQTPDTAIDWACDILNENLNAEQRLDTFDSLADILVADRRVCESEEHFLDYLLDRLGIVEALRKRLNSREGF